MNRQLARMAANDSARNLLDKQVKATVDKAMKDCDRFVTVARLTIGYPQRVR